MWHENFKMLALAAALILPAHAAVAQDPILLRVSSQLPPSSPVSQGLELWKTDVEKGTNGRVKVELYHSSQLYKDREVFPAVQSKSIEMGLVIVSQFAAYDPAFGIFDLPGLFRSYDQTLRAMDGRLGQELAMRLDGMGTVPLYWPQQGFVEIGTTNQPLNSPADFKGLKLRTHSKELARMAQLLGASPTVIAASEVSTALSRNTIDGMTATLSSFYRRKWFESAKHVTRTHFGLVGVAIVMNKEVWTGLPADIKAVVKAASRAAEKFSTETTISEEQEVVGKLEEAGIKLSEFDEAGRKEFARLAAPLYDEYIKAAGPVGGELVEYVRSLK